PGDQAALRLCRLSLRCPRIPRTHQARLQLVLPLQRQDGHISQEVYDRVTCQNAQRLLGL
ncbi:MAG: hypothetical protein ACOCX2_07680, partial [Armatimonadota bacterium]